MRRTLSGKAASSLTALSVFLAVLSFERSVYPLLMALTVLFHELGHVALAWAVGAPVRALGGGPYRLCLYYDPARVSYGREGLICAGGVIFNLILAAVTLPFLPAPRAEFLFVSNVAAALFNLLPLRMLDGGGVLRCFLLSHRSPEEAERISRSVSFFFTVALFLVSVYAQLALGGSFSLFALSVYMIADTVLRG